MNVGAMVPSPAFDWGKKTGANWRWRVLPSSLKAAPVVLLKDGGTTPVFDGQSYRSAIRASYVEYFICINVKC